MMLYECLQDWVGMMTSQGNCWRAMGPSGWLEDLVLEEEPNSGKPSNEAGCLFVAAQLAARPQHARTLETGMIQIKQRTNGQCE